ncbi:MAG: hypothetical protein J7521_10785 [Caulobacter sp.]|nr:hypothetical protein [Caulobacter sp.]
MRPASFAFALVLMGIAVSTQGCLAVAAGGAVVGATGAVVGTAGKAVVATGKAVVPGESKKDREQREFREWKRRQGA